MIKIFLKHLIYEKCIDILFDSIYRNFTIPQKIINRFKIKWTMEPQQIFESYHGTDIYNELSKAIQKEIDEEILKELIAQAP